MKNLSKIISISVIFQISIVIFSSVFVPVSFGQIATSTLPMVEFQIMGLPSSSIVKDNSVSYGVTKYNATISWTTNKPSDSHVVYSMYKIVSIIDPQYENIDQSGSASVISHKVVLKSLSPGVKYYYYVYSTDVDGNRAQLPLGDNNYYEFSTPSEPNSQLPPPASGYGSGGIGDTTPPPVTAITAPQITLELGGDSQIIGDTSKSFILTIYKYALGVVGLIALGVIMYGGILRLTSAGNPSKITEGNSYIVGAILGIALLGGSAMIFNTVNPQITKVGEIEEKINLLRKLEKPESSSFDLSFLSSSTAIQGGPMVNQYLKISDQDIKSQMRQDGIVYSKGTDFENMTPLQYDKLRAISDRSFRSVNVLTTDNSNPNSFIVNIKKSFDPKDLLNTYLSFDPSDPKGSNLKVINFGNKIYSLQTSAGQVGVKDMGNYWQLSL